MSAELIVNEIFTSIDGEGKTAGMLTTFIRLAGCNLRCKWCDTAYALQKGQGEPMSVATVADAVQTHAVTITGGEPLEQPAVLELAALLMQRGIAVNVETNGSRSVEPLLALPHADSLLLVTLDWKLPGSGMEKCMNPQHFRALRPGDVLKFVVASAADLARAREVVEMLQPPCYIYLSPVFGAIEPESLVEALKEWHAAGVDVRRMRVQLQLHKIIWAPDRRGV